MWKAVPVPEQSKAKEGFAELTKDTKLWYQDTGGAGPCVVLLHSMLGSSWAYQQPILVKSGYRVVIYYRRGYYKSTGNKENPGIGSEDLHQLVQFLGIKKFHLVGIAAGGGIATDYAISYPEKLISLVISSSEMGISEEEYKKLGQIIRPKFFFDLPNDFCELGPSYRAGNRSGVDAWNEVIRQVLPTGEKIRQKYANEITWKMVERIKVPTLLIIGEADLYTPPSVGRLQAKHIPHAEVVVISEAAHAPNWEQPEIFNHVLLQFLAKHNIKSNL
eukprot:TRINITY_DN6634_c0_g1_i1.p1 TRINITY_DN6634_c0_g1~~TRINITY_DN6634_c0_g1_i1.p1  ORF type:complete len:275 (-),score=57.31 TRINITY_DN6634_c0_g1_i1:31-855(-)